MAVKSTATCPRPPAWRSGAGGYDIPLPFALRPREQSQARQKTETKRNAKAPDRKTAALTRRSNGDQNASSDGQLKQSEPVAHGFSSGQPGHSFRTENHARVSVFWVVSNSDCDGPIIVFITNEMGWAIIANKPKPPF